MYFIILATDDNKASGSNYTDVCMAETGTPCTFCCIVSKGECSRDIRACHPVAISQREFSYLYTMAGLIASVVCGLPLLAGCLKCCMTVRCCRGKYEYTQGVTCMELVCRGLFYCVVKFDEVKRRASQENGIYGGAHKNDEEENQELHDDVALVVQKRPPPSTLQEQ